MKKFSELIRLRDICTLQINYVGNIVNSKYIVILK